MGKHIAAKNESNKCQACTKAYHRARIIKEWNRYYPLLILKIVIRVELHKSYKERGLRIGSQPLLQEFYTNKNKAA